jgi:uncharacterized protein (DUF2237 family)
MVTRSRVSAGLMLLVTCVWFKAPVLAEHMTESAKKSTNVLGGELESCCTAPLTGFYRDGLCRTGPKDVGSHVVCAEVTEEFLVFTRSRGNDLSTPRPEFDFPGLKAGDRWCLCALRWREALDAGVAPPVLLESCNSAALRFVAIEDLKRHALGNRH